MAVGLRWMLAALGAEGESAASVRGILTAHGFAPPISVRDLAGALAPIRLRFELTPSTCSGWCELAVTPDGTVDYSGHIHNSGLADIRYCTITSVPIPGGPMLVGHQGFVGGTLGLDSRDEDWHASGHSDLVMRGWSAFRAASVLAKTQCSANIGATELLTTITGGGSGFWVFGVP